MSKKNFFINSKYPVRENIFSRPLINGEDAWKCVYEDISNAKKTIHMCFWAIESDFELIRNDKEQFCDPNIRSKNTIYNILRKKVKEGVKVRILLWDWPFDSLVNMFINNAAIRIGGKTGLFEVLFQPHPGSSVSKEQFFGSWHQKTIIIDEDIAYVSGMNAKENDWDTSNHNLIDIKRAKFRMTGIERREIYQNKDYKALNPPRQDYMVQLKEEIVKDVSDNFVERWNYCINKKYDFYNHATPISLADIEKTSRTKSSLKTTSDTIGQISRTIPSYEITPKGEKSVLDTYLNAIALAEKYIYIEDQYFRSQTLSNAIAKACLKNKNLIVIVVTMPTYLTQIDPEESYKMGHPVGTYWTAEAFKIIKAVKPNFRLFHLLTYQKTGQEFTFYPIFIHSKIMIIDDEWYTIGSCNINDRGFEYEGELNVSIHSPKEAKEFRKAVFSRHMRDICPDDIDEAFRVWVKQVNRNMQAWLKRNEPSSFIFMYNENQPFLPASYSTWF